MAGAPGSGKTTLLSTVQESCRTRGIAAYTVVEAARPVARRTALGRAASRLPEAARGKALWGVFRLWSAVHTVGFAMRRPALVSLVFRSQRHRPAGSDAGSRRVLYWWLRLAGSHGFLMSHGRASDALVLDEGFVHRTVQLFASSVERPDQRAVEAYIGLVPQPDLLIHVASSPEVCGRRVRERGVWGRLAHRSSDEVDSFVNNAHRTIELAVEAGRDRRWHVVDVDNDGASVAAVVGDLGRRLEDELVPVAGVGRRA